MTYHTFSSLGSVPQAGSRKTSQISLPGECRSQYPVKIEYLVPYWPSWPMEEGDTASLFFGRPRAVSGSETRIDQWQAFIFFNIIQASSKRRQEIQMRRILHEPVGGTPRHVCNNFRAKNRTYDLPVFTTKHNLFLAKNWILKPSLLKEITYLTHFYAQKSKCPRSFWEMNSEILRTCSTCTHQGLPSVFLSFFWPNHVGPRWAIFSK